MSVASMPTKTSHGGYRKAVVWKVAGKHVRLLSGDVGNHPPRDEKRRIPDSVLSALRVRG